MTQTNMPTSSRPGFSKRLLPYAGTLVSLSLAIDLVPAQAYPALSSSIQSQLIQPQPAQAKQARGRVPGRRRGGGRRGECPAASTDLTALVPATNVVTQTLPETYVGSSTTAERPTLWFYVPYALTADLTAEFILQDAAGQNIYQISSADFPASEQTPGIISVSLPATIAPLKVGEVYQWFFKLSCTTEAFAYVQGGIERIPLNPDLASQLANASLQEQVNLYLANDLGYDAINLLAQLRRTRPTNTAINSAWIDLLRSLNLEDVNEDFQSRNHDSN
jgi:Domain of Unknown Function (DUF928)